MEKRYLKKFKSPYRWEGRQLELYARKNPMLFIQNIKADLLEFLSSCAEQDKADIENALQIIAEAEAASEDGNKDLVGWRLFELGYFVGANDYAQLINKAARNIAGSAKGGAANAKEKKRRGDETKQAVFAEYDRLKDSTPPRDMASKIAKIVGRSSTRVRQILNSK